ncbi:hypothetical protein [Pilimelia anulata]|nr:hypothetical protein [Pilimelia anulata]
MYPATTTFVHAFRDIRPSIPAGTRAVCLHLDLTALGCWSVLPLPVPHPVGDRYALILGPTSWRPAIDPDQDRPAPNCGTCW